MMIDQDNPVIELTADDRCDRCNAQAIFLTRKDELEMLFCVHHLRQHKEKLIDAGFAIITDGVKAEEAGYGDLAFASIR